MPVWLFMLCFSTWSLINIWFLSVQQQWWWYLFCELGRLFACLFLAFQYPNSSHFSLANLPLLCLYVPGPHPIQPTLFCPFSPCPVCAKGGGQQTYVPLTGSVPLCRFSASSPHVTRRSGRGSERHPWQCVCVWSLVFVCLVTKASCM